MIGKLSIELNIQSHTIRFFANYLRPNLYISTLEFTTFASPEFFPNLSYETLEALQIGTLSPSQDPSTLSFLQSFTDKLKTSLLESNQSQFLICDSSENDYKDTYILILHIDPFIKPSNSIQKIEEFEVLIFKLNNEFLIENKIKNCEKSINQMILIEKSMKKYYQNISNELHTVQREIDHQTDAIKYFSNQNLIENQQKEKLEKKVRKLNKKVKKMHQKSNEVRNLYCVSCNNEKKNAMFMPCGHIELCEFCLEHIFKVKIGSLTTRSKKCTKCHQAIDKIAKVFY